MRKLFLFLSLNLFLGAAAFGQGTALLANYVNGLLLAPVFDVDPLIPSLAKHGNSSLGLPIGSQTYNGNLLSGSGYTAALYAGTAGSSSGALQLVGTTVFRVGPANDLPSGLLVSKVVSIANMTPGQRASFELRVWDNRGGLVASWEAAQADDLIAKGTSGVFTPLGVLGDVVGSTGPTVDSPLFLTGLTSFNIAVVPEPSTVALSLLCLGALAFCRRCKK